MKTIIQNMIRDNRTIMTEQNAISLMRTQFLESISELELEEEMRFNDGGVEDSPELLEVRKRLEELNRYEEEITTKMSSTNPEKKGDTK